MLIALQIIGGLSLLFIGGEVLVRGAVAIARHFGIPTIIIGLTIVAIGTSAPEILVSVSAAINDHADLAIGNIIGSNISNILLVLAVTSIISTVHIHNSVIVRDAPILLAVTLLFICLCWTDKEISPIEGIVLMTGLVAYIAYTIKTAKSHKDKEKQEIEEELPSDTSNLMAAGLIVGGILALAFGANILVEGSVALARIFNIPEAIIGLTIVAIGSSTPELATCIIAAYRKHSDIVAGNIVGSNLLNILAGISVPALITPLPIAESFFQFDLWLMLGTTIAIYIVMVIAKKVSRIAGIVFFLGYIGYITSLFLQINA